MRRVSTRYFLILICLLALPYTSPAPLIYTPGEGWTYEPVGGTGKWMQTRAKDQLEVSQAAFDKGAYDLALKSARRTVRVWPLSDYAPQAQYLVGRSYEGKGNLEKAFKEYQRLLEKHPKFPQYQEVVERQYEIANRFLAGRRFRLWGFLPLFKSMDKTSDMYAKVVRNGPFTPTAPQAQMKIGAAREKQKNYPLAVRAYEVAADRYHDQSEIASLALYKAGLAYQKQAKRAEYDQSAAGSAINTFNDFITLYPDDARVAESQKIIDSLRTEQARGNFQTAQFYEKRKKWGGALVYYNEVLLLDPNSNYATEARKKIDDLKTRMAGAAK